MSMFCYQCEQTAKGIACTVQGVCGKDSETAALQDLLVVAAQKVATFAHTLKELGGSNRKADVFVIEALFATVTNVNFDAARIEQLIRSGRQIGKEVYAQYTEKAQQAGKEPIAFCDCEMPDTREGLVELAGKLGIEGRKSELGDDVAGLQELILYGLKGAASYADHIVVLKGDEGDIFATFNEILSYLAGNPTDADELTATALKVGELNFKVMELLDKANTETYGHPEPTSVRVTPVAGKCILVSGHDLKDLGDLLAQTVDKGINVYTHGEMLPTLAYPELKKYSHLVGNYGGAWQDQQKEFDEFPGPILLTTNCLMKPRESYKDRVFTNGMVGWPGVKHITNNDFAPVIASALAADGFAEDAEEKTIMVGFARNAVLGVADKIVEAVKAGQIKHFFLVGGCDGAKTGRNYFTEFAEAVPDDCVILTLACGKYRFNKLEFGDIGGIPRLLDVGQCNDAYSAIQIALALADAFECGVNDLPLSMIISWYEQKAVAILLTLLHLGIQNIRIGPSLPAFITPPVLDVLVKNFNLMPITSAKDDLKAILAN